MMARPDIPTVHFKDRVGWRAWLERRHANASEVWLVYFKKHSQKPSVRYKEALEEALCFGWIDSIVRRLDDEKYMQKYTPRKKNSGWSKVNREKAEKLISAGKMTAAGLAKIEEAKENGQWQRAFQPRQKVSLPVELKIALMKERTAWKNFCEFSKSSRDLYVRWVADAKKAETRERRIAEVVRRSAQKQKPGMM